MKQLLTKKLNRSQGVLVQQCQQMANVVERDLSTLNKFGITEDVLHAFVDQITAYSAITNDEKFKTNLAEKSRAKQDLRAELNDHVQYLMHRIALVYGKSSLAYKSFAARSYYDETESEMVRKSKLMIESMAEHLPELNKKNIQQSDLDKLHALVESYQAAILAQKVEKYLRRVAREERQEKGIALYEKMMELAETGKVAWERTSYAKYLEYKLS